MPRVQFAVQIFEPGPTRSKWKTIYTAKRLAVAETILRSVRQDRVNVASLSRVRPFIRLPYRAAEA